jgi:hypothetical protein
MIRHSTTPARILFVVALAVALCRSLPAATLYVSPSGTNCPPYATWTSAATNIQDAINAAVDGDSVLVSNGTYVLSQQIIVTSGVSVSSVNGPEFTIIDGNHSTRCIFISHSNAVVSGFTVTKGIHADSFGGGGVCILGEGTVADCHITSNTAEYGGGVVCYFGGVVDTCTISFNTAGSMAGGGGFYCLGGGELRHSLILSNTASFGGGGRCEDGGMLTNCTINENFAWWGGGGVYIAPTGALYECTIWSNRTHNQFGGGVYAKDAILGGCDISYNNARVDSGGGAFLTGYSIVERCTVRGNRAFSGGGIECRDGTTVDRCRIWENTAEYCGGGLAAFGSTGWVRSCIVMSNTAPRGGGIAVGNPSSIDPSTDSSTVIENCTVFGNVATNGGSGVFVMNLGSTQPRLQPDERTEVRDHPPGPQGGPPGAARRPLPSWRRSGRSMPPSGA